ncbi:MAG: eutM 1 [Eubacterium sp.]|nr:eutM 1 [Eubacterium sp.]
MVKSIGIVEIKNVTRGIYIADSMLKGANVQLLQSAPVCPGKYITVVWGELAAINSAIDIAKENGYDYIIDSFIIGNISEQVIPAIMGVNEIKNREAVGIVETFTAAAVIEAADSAVKAAVVELVEVRIARGMGGKCFAIFTGDVASVEAAAAAGAARAREQGLLVDSVVIPRPHEELWASIL